MAELQQLQEFEIPTGREALRGNHSALLRVADYCEDNYVQATDKRKALEETMAFTTQALASVAYQVGNLAGHTLRMLDLQGAALRQVEARVSTLGQGEGHWTQTTPLCHLEPCHADGEHAHGEGGPKGDRHLSHCPAAAPGPEGHCPREPTPSHALLQETPQLWLPGRHWPWDQALPPAPSQDLSTQLSRTGTLSRKSIKAPATPASATLGRPPRIPEPVHLPVVPDGRLSAASSASSLASAGAEGVGGASMPKGQAAPPAPPLPNSLDPPPPPAAVEVFQRPPPLEELSPPPPDEELPLPLDLPPPPPLDGDELGLPPPPPGFGPDEPSWVPASYLEKVVTLYPYIGQKDNELSFSEGTVICVTRRYSDGWCEGISSEGTGFFPGNYVEPSC
ncbi:ABI gene family member 3 isoform X2 [Papio anubis]|uniref:ABI gene family member 3 isoform X2 n=1 Tax=Papio anubis TaxID=9555 RepID=UPI000B7B2AD1|nr:ABI gene family member 3 isoform X2 [Papio anubis]